MTSVLQGTGLLHPHAEGKGQILAGLTSRDDYTLDTIRHEAVFVWSVACSVKHLEGRWHHCAGRDAVPVLQICFVSPSPAHLAFQPGSYAEVLLLC